MAVPDGALHFPHKLQVVRVQSLLQHGPLQKLYCFKVGQATPLHEAAILTVLVLVRKPDFSHLALQAPHEPQFDVTQFTGQHLKKIDLKN